MRVSLVALLAACLSVAACGGDDKTSKPFKGGGGSGGTNSGGSGGGIGGASGSGGVGGAGGSGGVGGSGAAGGSAGAGGSGGAGGPEICTDGLDNDKNGLTDCADPACATACTSACATPTVLADPAVTQGNTATHIDSLNSSCSGSPSGPDLAYEFTAKNSGVFEAILGGFSSLTLSLRSACGGSELACTKGNSIKMPVTAGTKLWVVVDGASGGAGPFGLSVQSRPIACGDSHKDGTEACDDGNTKSGDGCSSSCTVEIGETEPNGTAAQANAWKDPFVATIASGGDVDVIKVTVTKAGGTISASVQDLGDGACVLNQLDSHLALWDAGESILVADDNSGEGNCSALSKSGLAAGTYYLVVKAAPGANPATFAYKLIVTLT